MTTQPPATLCALFDDLKLDSSRVAIADDASLASAVRAHSSTIKWTASAAEFLPKVAELLDIQLSHVFVAFWQKADEIARAMEESRRSPYVPIETDLYDCSTTATLEPYIEVRLNGVAPGKRIPVTVSLPLTFKAVKLRIQNGSIVSVAGGECEIDGVLKLDNLTLAKLKEPLTVTLGEWEFKHQEGVAP